MNNFIFLSGILCLSVFSFAAARCPRTVTRRQWGARAPHDTSPIQGKPYTVIVQEAGHSCNSRGTCPRAVKDVQATDMLVKGEPDVGCNFLIGSDGAVYQGRGWDRAVIGNKAIVICILGQFEHKSPDDIQVKTLTDFLSCSRSQLASHYTVRALRDEQPVTQNPGKRLYDVIKKLPNYQSPTTSGQSSE